jgi:hypothetical protein
VKSRPADCCCPQWDRFLTLNHKCEVMLCCVVPETHEAYSLGSIFDLSALDVLGRKTSSKECDDCIDCGVAYWVHNPVMLEKPARPEQKPKSLAARLHVSRRWLQGFLGRGLITG